MDEYDATGVLIAIDQPGLLGRSEIAVAGVAGTSGPQNARIAGAVQGRAQQEMAGRSRKLAHPRREQRPE